MAIEWRGKALAEQYNQETLERVTLLELRGVKPCLALVRVDTRAETEAYISSVSKRAAKMGLKVQDFVLPPDAAQRDLETLLDHVNQETSIHACLLLRPLPAGFDEKRACSLLSPDKDADGITPTSMAAVYAGERRGFLPCTAEACVALMDYFQYSPDGKRVVIIGRSLVIGRPLAMLLLSRHATVTICHSHTMELPALCREADVLVTALGRAAFVDEAYLRPGQLLLDVGTNINEQGQLCGDIEPEAAARKAWAYTPVPGGVGAVTSALLLRHAVEAAERQTAR